jgi:hypothetical protein
MSGPSADATLITLCQEYLDRHDKLARMAASLESSDEFFRAITSSVLGLRGLLDKIRWAPPLTPEGWNAVFRVCIVLLGDAESDTNDTSFIRSALCWYCWPAVRP